MDVGKGASYQIVHRAALAPTPPALWRANLKFLSAADKPPAVRAAIPFRQGANSPNSSWVGCSPILHLPVG